MKGIYLSPEGKQEIEAKIPELELVNKRELEYDWQVRAAVTYGAILMLKEILSSAIVLPVENDYCNIQEKYFDVIKNDISPDTKLVEVLQDHFRDGVIIQA